MIRKNFILIVVLAFSLAFCASAQTKLQRERESDPKYHYNMGLVHLNQNNLDMAIKSFVKCLSIDTGYYLAWNAIGLTHSLKGNLQESIKAYEKCLELNPQFTEARNNLGTIYQELNYLDKAEIEFSKALTDKTYTNKELPYYNLARLYYVQDRLQSAYENVQAAIQHQPRLAMAHNLLGLILEKWDRLPEAITAYEKAVKIVPEDVTFNFNLAAAYYNNQDLDRAKEKFLFIYPKITDPDLKQKATDYLKILGLIKQPG